MKLVFVTYCRDPIAYQSLYNQNRGVLDLYCGAGNWPRRQAEAATRSASFFRGSELELRVWLCGKPVIVRTRKPFKCQYESPEMQARFLQALADGEPSGELVLQLSSEYERALDTEQVIRSYWQVRALERQLPLLRAVAGCLALLTVLLYFSYAKAETTALAYRFIALGAAACLAVRVVLDSLRVWVRMVRRAPGLAELGNLLLASNLVFSLLALALCVLTPLQLVLAGPALLCVALSEFVTVNGLTLRILSQQFYMAFSLMLGLVAWPSFFVRLVKPDSPGYLAQALAGVCQVTSLCLALDEQGFLYYKLGSLLYMLYVATFLANILRSVFTAYQPESACPFCPFCQLPSKSPQHPLGCIESPLYYLVMAQSGLEANLPWLARLPCARLRK